MATQDSPAFQGVLADLEGLDEKALRDQIERAHQIEALTSHPGWPFFRDYLAALTVTTQKRVLDGTCSSIEEYRFLTGFVKGLRKAMDAPEALMERVQFLLEQAQQAEEPSDLVE